MTGCATDPYGYNHESAGAARRHRVQRSAARCGAATRRSGRRRQPGDGAVVGAVLGGVAGAVIKGKQYYRDTRGYCYYVDQYGNPIYDYNVRC